jgi:hypothetical protein
MSELEKAAWLAIEALDGGDRPEFWTGEPLDPKGDALRVWRLQLEAAEALRAALAQQQAEPVAIPGAIPMSELAARSRAMPERADALERASERLEQAESVAWVGLTDAEIYECWPGSLDPLTIARAIEQALKEKNK